MASPPVEVKKAISAKQLAPEPWQSLRGEMDRLFERFSRSFGLPSLRRTFDVEPSSVYESSFNFPTTAVDICEDDKTYKLTAEMPGLEAKHIDVSVTDSTLRSRGRSTGKRNKWIRIILCPNAPTDRSSVHLHYPSTSMRARSRPICQRGC